jgi:hypothetical protein
LNQDLDYLAKKKDLYRTVYNDFDVKSLNKKHYLCDKGYLSKLKEYEVTTY